MRSSSSLDKAWIGMAVVMASLLGTAIAARPARACSCTASDGWPLWPLADAIDVPIDTPMVVEVKNWDGDPSAVPIRLEDESGTEIALLETRRIEQQSEPSCLAHETVFLRPAKDLAAGAAYSLFVGNEAARSFMTGSQHYEPSAYPEPNVRYVHVGSVQLCTESTWGCELAMLEVAFEAPVKDGVWLVMRSAAAEDHENTHVFGPTYGSPETLAITRSVALPAGDPCFNLGLYGVDGSVVLERELCTPDSCVLYGSRTGSSCGEPPQAALDITRVPLGHCDAPLEIEDGSNGPIYPEPSSDAGDVLDAGDAADAGDVPDTDRDDAGATLKHDSGVPPAMDERDDAAVADPQPAKETYGCSCSTAPSSRGQALWPGAVWIAFGLVARIAARSRRRTA